MSESYKDAVRDENDPSKHGHGQHGHPKEPTVGPQVQEKTTVKTETTKTETVQQQPLTGRALRLHNMAKARTNAHESLGAGGKAVVQLAGMANAAGKAPFSIIQHVAGAAVDIVKVLHEHAQAVGTDVAMAHSDGTFRMTAHLNKNNPNQEANLHTTMTRARQVGYTIEEMASGMGVTKNAIISVLDFESEEAKVAASLS